MFRGDSDVEESECIVHFQNVTGKQGQSTKRGRFMMLTKKMQAPSEKILHEKTLPSRALQALSRALAPNVDTLLDVRAYLQQTSRQPMTQETAMPTKCSALHIAAIVCTLGIVHCGAEARDEEAAAQPNARTYTIAPADAASGEAAQAIPANADSQPFLNLQPGDVLQKIDGETVPDVTSPDVALMLYEKIRNKAEVRVTVLRNGQSVEYPYPVD